jgi:hypothetical protein
MDLPPFACFKSELTSEIINRLDSRQMTGDLGRCIGPQHGLCRTAQVQKIHGHTAMPPVGFKSTIAELERRKTVRNLDRTVIEIGINCASAPQMKLYSHTVELIQINNNSHSCS